MAADHCGHDADEYEKKAQAVGPAQLLFQDCGAKDRKRAQAEKLLDDFELRRCEGTAVGSVTNAVGGHLQTVPANEQR